MRDDDFRTRFHLSRIAVNNDSFDVFQCMNCQRVEQGAFIVDCPSCGADDGMRPAPAKVRERLVRGRG